MAEHAHVIAFVEGAAQAVEARPTGGVERSQHAVAGRDATDAVPGLDHGADELVSDREAGLDLYAAVVDVQIRAADAGGVDLDDRVILGLKLGLRALLNPHLSRRLEGHGSHRRPPSCLILSSRSAGR